MKLEYDINFLIDNHFTELSRVKIKTDWHKEKDSFAYTTGTALNGFKITFSKKDYKKLNKAELFGVLSHELAHILYDKKSGIFMTMYRNVRMRFSPSYLTKIERRIDKIVLDKSCGHYLLAFLEYHDKKYKKYKKADGLTKKEVKAYLENDLDA